jgi:hypothetical protein
MNARERERDRERERVREREKGTRLLVIGCMELNPGPDHIR